MGGTGDILMIGVVAIGGYLLWKHKDEILPMLSPQQAAAAPAPAPAPAAAPAPAEPLQAACCVCHAADSGNGFECLVVADPGKVYKYKDSNTVEEATALCIVDHCAGADKDDEGNDLPPRENRQKAKKSSDDVVDNLNKKVMSKDDGGDDFVAKALARAKSAPKQPQGPCPAGQYAVTKSADIGHIYVECKKLSSKYTYTNPSSYYGNMGRYKSYDTRKHWEKGFRNNGKNWGGDHDRDDDHHWDSKHVYRFPRPVIRSNVVVYNPFAYYYAPPPLYYYPPPVYPVQYW